MLIALKLVRGLGEQKIRNLLETVDRPGDIFRMSPEELKRVDGIGPVLANHILEFDDGKKVNEILAAGRKAGAMLVSCLDENYPPLLRQIYDPPVLLWVKGDPSVLNSRGIAVVGTRRATRYGLDKAKDFSRQLVGRGMTIVSGLALGVDGAAHRTTLKEGGHTIAVLGSGIDRIYPPGHRRLAADIVRSGGALITEYQPGTAPKAGHFPERNRIVSGMTLGTLVVESSIKGGSMITARSALDQNREVFVVPHSLENRNGVGCNAILKRGWGKLVQQAEDIMVELPGMRSKDKKEKMAGDIPREAPWKSQSLGKLGTAMCKRLEERAYHLDELSGEMNLPPHKLLPKLLELEMSKCIRQLAGKKFELRQ